jgi:hypothetical protein
MRIRIHITVALVSIAGAAVAGLIAAQFVTLTGDSRGYAIVSAVCFGYSGVNWVAAHFVDHFAPQA